MVVWSQGVPAVQINQTSEDPIFTSLHPKSNKTAHLSIEFPGIYRNNEEQRTVY
jgi:hypothetical protein